MISQHILIKDFSLPLWPKMVAFLFLTILFSIGSLAIFLFGVFPSCPTNTDVTVHVAEEDTPFLHLHVYGDFLIGHNK